MKWLEEIRSVAISDIRKPSEWKEVLLEDRTKELAANLKLTDGPVSLPVLHASTLTIIAGTHRIAAMVHGGETHVTCRLFSGDTLEEELVRSSDNAFPRHDYDAWVDRRVKALAALIEKQRSESGQAVRSGRTTPVGEAREIVAREANTTKEAVRKSQERTARAEREDNEAPTPGPVVEPAPQPPSLLSRLKKWRTKFSGPGGAIASGPVRELGELVLEVQEHYKRYQSGRDKHDRLTPAAWVWKAASALGVKLDEVEKEVENLCQQLEGIEAALREPNRAPGEGPRTGLRGAKL